MGTKDDKSYKTRTRYLIVLIIYIQCYLPGRKEEKEESFNLLERVRLMILVLSYAEISVPHQSYVLTLFITVR